MCIFADNLYKSKFAPTDTMLVLFETPAGYAVFKLLDEGKLAKSDSLYEDFSSLDKAKSVVKLKGKSTKRKAKMTRNDMKCEVPESTMDEYSNMYLDIDI